MPPYAECESLTACVHVREPSYTLAPNRVSADAGAVAVGLGVALVLDVGCGVVGSEVVSLPLGDADTVGDGLAVGPEAVCFTGCRRTRSTLRAFPLPTPRAVMLT